MKVYCIYCQLCKKVSSDRAYCETQEREIGIETAWSLRDCIHFKYQAQDVFKR